MPLGKLEQSFIEFCSLFKMGFKKILGQVFIDSGVIHLFKGGK
jgi:hypothetical protein